MAAQKKFLLKTLRAATANIRCNCHSNVSQETHFGFETVSKSSKAGRVHTVFENVAEKYDLMNDLMSGGIHRAWKNYLVSQINVLNGNRMLDVAGGTGDIAMRYINQLKYHNKTLSTGDIVVCDINQAMLDVGKIKASRLGLSQEIIWVCGNGEDLPFQDNSFDVYTIAFGLRNFTNTQKALDEAYRVLAPGGKFLCLEFSAVKNPFLKRLYDEYSFQVIPVMGEVIAKDWSSYQYLVESIRQFPDQVEFSALITTSGFKFVKYENLTFGVAAIHSGFKL
ncbi:2-methoxy-6-polyprenyl-1,4-benzoquinol methylase, mitochondrial-like [Xenia sp. Carnegie-2017]|uniref:2-methoxy-6-polyprenyl-1,4-benzoquinol methylase, mitochondrial-like n=1 Tax=Xenia sp. Carnegie-2017 TaxID=2897299 RepID=UPI001F044403|nr:2-methoxy-6-polyprenyl-1,4-benzoquinol methylase, mitochondrial-like [Xenia sp. Carnegie-2017]